MLFIDQKISNCSSSSPSPPHDAGDNIHRRKLHSPEMLVMPNWGGRDVWMRHEETSSAVPAVCLCACLGILDLTALVEASEDPLSIFDWLGRYSIPEDPHTAVENNLPAQKKSD